MTYVDMNVGMSFVKLLQAFRSSNDAHEFDVDAAVLFDLGDCIDSRTAGRKHGIGDDDRTLFDGARKFAVVFVGLMGLFVAVHSDVAYLSGGNQRKQSGDHAKTCTKDRNDGQFAAGDHRCGAFLDGSFDLDFLSGKIGKSFEAFQSGNFFRKFAEFVGTGIFVTHERDLMLDQRMSKNGNIRHVVEIFHDFLLFDDRIGKIHFSYDTIPEKKMQAIPIADQTWYNQRRKAEGDRQVKYRWLILFLCLFLTGCAVMNGKEEKKEASSGQNSSTADSIRPGESSIQVKPEESSKEELVIWKTDEMPVKLRYDRYWEYGDYVETEDPAVIEAIIQVVKALRVGEKSEYMVDDFTDILTFTFPDGGMIRLEFEEYNWVVSGERYRVEGLGALRHLLDQMIEERNQVWQEEKANGSDQQDTRKQIFVADAEHVVIFALNDSPAALSLYKQLPIEVEVENYSSNEKIFYPPEELDTTDGIEGGGEAGVLAYFSPWGNVVMYYGPFDAYPGLYILGEAIDFAEEIENLSGTIYIGVVQ